MRHSTTFLLILPMLFATGASAAEEPKWSFDPNTLKLSGPWFNATVRPVGQMHGIVIDKLGDAASPVSPNRAFLNLEHYLEKGRWGEYLPRKLDHSVDMDARHLTIHFPRPQDWPVVSELTYTFQTPSAIDARLDFAFSDKLTQFEVYFTSYFAPQYERSVRVKGQWQRPQISDREQLLIPRDDAVAARYEDGRWGFLKGRTRLSDDRFDLPVMLSRDDATGWCVVQMIEPGKLTHIAPNRFAVGHNFILGGWDVGKGDKRSVRIRLLVGKDLSTAAVEQAYEAFAADCKREQEREKEKPRE